jgi:hypothetical protein
MVLKIRGFFAGTARRHREQADLDVLTEKILRRFFLCNRRFFGKAEERLFP